MIILETYCGLCNRLRAIQSTLDLAEKYGHSAMVIWAENPNCYCKFEDLFQPTDRFRLMTLHDGSLLDKVKRQRYRWQAEACHARLSQTRMDEQKLYDGALEKALASQLADPGSVIYIDNWNAFFHSGKPAYDWLKLQPELEAEVAPYRAKIGSNGIGVHIRRTDNADSIAQSPTSLFIESMEAEIEKNPECTFYVATDDIREKEQLRAVFGDRIVYKPNQRLDRESLAGMKDCILDLYCLAATKKIYGSFYSSFSEEAARIGGCEVEIRKK